MAVPAQVQARADKADELLKQQASNKETPAAGDSAKPTEDRDKSQPAAAETVDSLKALLAETQQKLATLQGKYNSEIQALKDDVNLLTNLKGQVRQLNGQLQDASGKLSEANRQIGDLQKQLSERPAAPAADDGKAVLSSLSEEDLEYLRGEGFDDKAIGILLKALAGKGQAKPNQNNDELAQIKKEMQDEKVRKFWSEISEKVPDWESINSGDPFNDWLDEKLPYSNQTRRDRLQGAQRELDYGTVIQLFNDFKRDKPAAGKNKPEHQIDPNKQIDPNSSVVNQQDPEGKIKPAGKIYTRQEIKEFYAELSKAAAKNGVTDEMKKTDADIIKANAEGRIQG